MWAVLFILSDIDFNLFTLEIFRIGFFHAATLFALIARN